MGVGTCRGMWKAQAHVYGHGHGQPAFSAIFPIPISIGEGSLRGGTDEGQTAKPVALPTRGDPAPDHTGPSKAATNAGCLCLCPYTCACAFHMPLPVPTPLTT